MLNFTKTQKQIILGLKMVVFGFLSWFFLHQLFYSEISIAFIVLTVLGLIFWAIAVCAGVVVLDKRFLYPAFILSLLSFFIFFHGSEIGPGDFRIAMYYFLIMILIFITFLIFRTRVLYDKKTRLKLHFWRIFTKKGLSWVFTMLCLLIVFAYYFSPSLGNLSPSIRFDIPRSFVDAILKPFGALGPEVSDFAYEFINSQISGSGALGGYLPIALAVGLFLSLRVIVIVLVPVVILLSSLSMKLAISLGFIKLTVKKAETEDVEL